MTLLFWKYSQFWWNDDLMMKSELSGAVFKGKRERCLTTSLWFNFGGFYLRLNLFRIFILLDACHFLLFKRNLILEYAVLLVLEILNWVWDLLFLKIWINLFFFQTECFIIKPVVGWKYVWSRSTLLIVGIFVTSFIFVGSSSKFGGILMSF